MDHPAPLTVSSSLDRGVMRGADLKARLDAIIDIADHAMKENVDYGKVPGTDKPSLWQAGADKLCVAFQIAPKIKTLDEIGGIGEKAYRVVVVGVHQGTGIELGEGVGECSSAEEKYAFRYAVHQNEYDWLPEDRKRLKFKRDGSTIMQVRTNPADVANTVLKMAVKRAKVAMALTTTGAAAIFTQDVEDLAEELREHLAEEDQRRPEPKQPQRKSQTGNGQTKAADAKVSDGALIVVGLVEKVGRPKDKKFFVIKLKGDDRPFTAWIDKFEQLEKDAKAFEGTDHRVKLAYVEEQKGDKTYYNARAISIADAEPVTSESAQSTDKVAAPAASEPALPLKAGDIFSNTERDPGSEG